LISRHGPDVFDSALLAGRDDESLRSRRQRDLAGLLCGLNFGDQIRLDVDERSQAFVFAEVAARGFLSGVV